MAFNSHGFAVRSAHNGVVELFLRHGLFGIGLYLLAFALFAIGIIQLFKKKLYRIACFYTICIVALLLHSVAESTTFFTPNIGGTYITLLFLLPIINETKEKHFKVLNADLQNTEIVVVSNKKKDSLYLINALIIGLIIALSSSLLIDYINHNIATLVAYLAVIGVLLGWLFISPLLVKTAEKSAYLKMLSYLTLKPIKDNLIAVIVTLLAGLIGAKVLPALVRFDLFASLLYSLCVFTVFFFTYSLFRKKENNPTIDYLNGQFTRLLQKISSEVSYE